MPAQGPLPDRQSRERTQRGAHLETLALFLLPGGQLGDHIDPLPEQVLPDDIVARQHGLADVEPGHPEPFHVVARPAVLGRAVAFSRPGRLDPQPGRDGVEELGRDQAVVELADDLGVIAQRARIGEIFLEQGPDGKREGRDVLVDAVVAGEGGDGQEALEEGPGAWRGERGSEGGDGELQQRDEQLDQRKHDIGHILACPS